MSVETIIKKRFCRALSFSYIFCFDFALILSKARTETRGCSISDQNLQCSQGICETVSNPYPFDDYLQQKQNNKAKEGYGTGAAFRYKQAHSNALSSPFSLPHDDDHLCTLKYAVAVEESDDILKVHIYQNSFLLSLSFFLLPAFLNVVECNVGYILVTSFLLIVTKQM